MAQVSFAKLAPKASTEVITIYFNEQEIEVKQYLPIEQKLEALTNILNSCADDMGYYNPAKVHVFIVLETVYHYTNIKFTDKQKEDSKKLYNQLVGSGLYEQIYNALPVVEANWLTNYTKLAMDQIYKYRDSIYGILDAMRTDYSDLELDVNGLRQQLAEADGLSTVKEVLDKLG